jgi:hypothetical protein
MQLLLGHRLTLIGRHSEAVEHLEKAAEDPALRFNARFDLGLAALASGDARSTRGREARGPARRG